MKKSMILLLIMVLGFTFSKEALAAPYNGYQDLTLYEGTLLRDFTDEEYENYYKKVNKRKMFGWRIKYVNEEVKARYVSETIFSYYNDGTSPLTYNYSLENSKAQKFSISGSGSIKFSKGASGKGFKNGLEAALDLDAKYEQSNQLKEKTDLKVTVDPHSQAVLRIVGEGLVTNGVACRYLFWIRANKGGFEYFIVTTEYPRLEILSL